ENLLFRFMNIFYVRRKNKIFYLYRTFLTYFNRRSSNIECPLHRRFGENNIFAGNSPVVYFQIFKSPLSMQFQQFLIASIGFIQSKGYLIEANCQTKFTL